MSNIRASSEDDQSSSSLNEDEPVRKRRKSNPKSWKRNKIRDEKAQGKEHYGWKGRFVPARTSGVDCG